MNIKIIRKIDYWLGIPLCFIFTIIDMLQNIFLPKKEEIKQKKKILLIKPTELGSIILSLPLIQQIKKTYPHAELFFLSNKNSRELFSLLQIIPDQHVYIIDDSSVLRIIVSLLKCIIQIRKEKIHISIDLEFFSRFSMITSYLSKAQTRVGFYRFSFEGLYRGGLLTHKIQYNPHLHISQLYLSILYALEPNRKDTPLINLPLCDKPLTLPRFTPPNKIKEAILKDLNKNEEELRNSLIIINPGEGLIPIREWPLKNFIKLIQMILELPDKMVIIVGTSRCQKKARHITKTINNERLIDLSDKTSISKLLTLLSLAKILINNDSGMAHLCSLTKTRQIVLFGPEHPSIFSPLGENVTILHNHFPCSPCLSVYNHRESNCLNNLCLQSIKPEEVYKLIMSFEE